MVTTHTQVGVIRFGGGTDARASIEAAQAKGYLVVLRKGHATLHRS